MPRISWLMFCLVTFTLLVQTRAIEIQATCGLTPKTSKPFLKLPDLVSGRIAFYAAAYRDGVLIPKSAIAVGDPNSVFPMESMHKTFVVHAAMQAVDAGILRLEQKFKTTPANRSVENYPKGSNSLLELATRAIAKSDNTASDILHIAVGTDSLARKIKTISPCTTILLTSKAYWAAQGGLSSSVLGKDLLPGAQRYAALPFEQRLVIASRLNAADQKVTAPAVERAIDRYFHSPIYTPELELWLQNTTTAQAFTDLLVKVLPTKELKPQTRKAFRKIMESGCCFSKKSPLPSVYRAAKAGSGWRMLMLSGYAEMPNGLSVAYTYLNDQSNDLDAEMMEKQIRPINIWIDQVLRNLKVEI
jgi:beta-lactamase class A